MTADRAALLRVQDLTTIFDSGRRRARRSTTSASQLRRGETLGLVGESGSGKSVTALSIMRLVQPPGRDRGRPDQLQRASDLLELTERDMRAIRGAEIGFIFQEPMTALNPVFTIGDQIAEALLVHRKATRPGARAKAHRAARGGAHSGPGARLRDYPHQLSGGMRQRVLIAIALACQPLLLIADEPTTALDVTIQAEILDLLREMKEAFHLSLLLITHDLGVVAGNADRVAVMYAGRIVEEGPVRQIFRLAEASLHPRAARVDSRRRRRASGCSAIEGTVPDLGEPAAGLRVRAALSATASTCARRRRRRRTTSARSARAVLSVRPEATPDATRFVEVRHLVKDFSRREGFLAQSHASSGRSTT